MFDKLARGRWSAHHGCRCPTGRARRACWSARPCTATSVLGPTADDVDARAGRAPPRRRPRRTCSRRRADRARLLDQEVTAVYVGLRAATEHGDYQYRFDARAALRLRRRDPLDRALGLDGDRRARREGLADAGLELDAEGRRPPEVRMPNIGEAVRALPEGRADRGQPRVRAHRLPLRARDARRDPRRARQRRCPPTTSTACAGARARYMGRCQGFYCGAELAARLDAGSASMTRAARPRRRASAGRRRRRRRAAAWRATLATRGGASSCRARGRAGGIPRHAQHPGFGIRDLRRCSAARATRAATRELARRPAPRCAPRPWSPGWSPDGAARADRPPRSREARARRRDPRDRVPRAAALGAARARAPGPAASSPRARSSSSSTCRASRSAAARSSSGPST